VELNCRRAGEDARVTMERARERRFNIEGRNLDAELDVAVPKPQGHVQAPVVGVGCAALVDHLRAVAWPSELGYQTSKKDLKGLYTQSDSEFGGDERRKKLYVMYGGSSELVSW
jgi:hypothetical protein